MSSCRVLQFPGQILAVSGDRKMIRRNDMSELSHLDELEAEAIYIIREVAAECEKPVMLYSIGKDSSVMLHLAMKAFYPDGIIHSYRSS